MHVPFGHETISRRKENFLILKQVSCVHMQYFHEIRLQNRMIPTEVPIVGDL
jgi:hypothetical protein